MNIVQSMLSKKKVPKEFWPEAVNWSICVLNESPTLTIKDVTHEEAWSDIKLHVDHFHVFKCVAHVHVLDSHKKKLDNKSFKCVLLGISEESKAYRLYDPVSKKIVTSRDVVCVENEKWNQGRSVDEVERDVLEQEENNEIVVTNEEGKGLEDE